MKTKLFPFRLGRLDKSFFLFFLRGLLNFFCWPASWFLLRLTRQADEITVPFWLSFTLVSVIASVFIWILALRNFFRYTQFLHKLFRKNPFQNEKQPQFVAVSTLSPQVILGMEPDFYNNQEEYFRQWRTLRDLCACILLILPRVVGFVWFKIKNRDL